MGLGKRKGHHSVIQEAGKLFDSSVSMFVEAEKKIDAAQDKLDATIEDLDAAIAELQALKEKAVKDKERNHGFKLKLKEFTAQ